jgi:hypothetical protein
LVLLHKKGDRTDPNNFRGISLLSSAEKILGIVVLNRIKGQLNQRLLRGQAGFRTGTSCRNAVFVLARKLEAAVANGTPMTTCFVDFSKAFDSLAWDQMWQVLSWQGVPEPILDVIRRMYVGSTIAIRMTPDGMLETPFQQRVGIRQGCSLSPALFVLVLDFALRVFEQACKDAGLNPDDCWLGYADDLAVHREGLSSVSEVQQMLLELQSACAFVGLHINAKKTEIMAANVAVKEVAVADATKERIVVTRDDGKHQGWAVEWAGRRHVVTEDEELALTTQGLGALLPTHVLVYDSGDKAAVHLKPRGGWLTDGDGEKHRARLLGGKEVLTRAAGQRCDHCDAVFHTNRGLSAHQKRGVCQLKEDMSLAAQSQLRHSRNVAEKRAGRTRLLVEQVEVVLDGGTKPLECTAQFQYLGSTLTSTSEATREIRRRTGLAAALFGTMGRTWDSRQLRTATKLRLYRALILSVMLYNAETWAPSKADIDILEGLHFRCLRRIVSRREVDGSYHIRKAEVYKAAGMGTMVEILRSRRLCWLGHMFRGDAEDPAYVYLHNMVTIGNGGGVRKGKWLQLAEEDLAAMRLTWQQARVRAVDRSLWKRTINVPPNVSYEDK